MVVVRPPSWRPDLRNGPDLVEEVARLRGYELIPSVLPTAPGGRGLTRRQRSTARVSAMLADAGLVEVLSYPFVSTKVFDQLGYPTMTRAATPYGWPIRCPTNAR